VLAAYAVQAVPPIHIIVKNGDVTLEGRVKSVADKSLAAQRAGSVANVVAVKNNLQVQPNQNAAE
jgi:osmotically-inducible protein OsmY